MFGKKYIYKIQKTYPADATARHPVSNGVDVHHLVQTLLRNDLYYKVAQFEHILMVKFLITVPGTARDSSVWFHIKQHIKLLGLADQAAHGLDQLARFEILEAFVHAVLSDLAPLFDCASPDAPKR